MPSLGSPRGTCTRSGRFSEIANFQNDLFENNLLSKVFRRPREFKMLSAPLACIVHIYIVIVFVHLLDVVNYNRSHLHKVDSVKNSIVAVEQQLQSTREPRYQQVGARYRVPDKFLHDLFAIR